MSKVAAVSNGQTEPRVVRFATDDPPPKLPVEIPRPSREGERWGDYIAAVAKAAGVIPHDASLSATRKQQLATDLLERAREDELFGGSRVGQVLLAADEEWRARNPEIAAELGRLGDSSRDLLGRSVRGPARAVALVLEHLTEDPTTTLTAPESELLRSLAPGVLGAIGALEESVSEHGEQILAAVNAAQATFPPGEPGPPVDRSEKTP